MISTSRQPWSRLSVPFCLSLSLFLKDSNYADPLIKLCHSEFFSPSVFVDLNLHCMNVRLCLCLWGLCNINHFLRVYRLTASFTLPLVLRNGLVSENVSNENICFFGCYEAQNFRNELSWDIKECLGILWSFAHFLEHSIL